jgi:thiamine biosynthesis lipoprotein
MGTGWSVLAVVDSVDRQAELERGVQAALDSVVAEMSQWEPDSDISRFNRASPGTWQTLPPDFAKVMAEALAIAELSGGAFDPAIGQASELWGFGASAIADLPRRDTLDEAMSRSGWRSLAFDAEAARLRQPGGLSLDLSGIAKGFGADRAGEALRQSGAKAFLVDVGGELLGYGMKPGMQPWWVELENPPGAMFAPFRVALHGLAIATSGDYRRYHDLPGKRLSHSLDPFTAAPVQNGIASVSVLARTAMRADALATTLTVMGDRSRAFADQHGIAARIVQRDGNTFTEELTDALAAMIE